MENLTQAERELIATALDDFAEGVEDVLRDDEWLAGPDARDSFPVVEDYQNDATRIRMGETPLHELTREVLRDDVPAMTDDPSAFMALVARLYA